MCRSGFDFPIFYDFLGPSNLSIFLLMPGAIWGTAFQESIDDVTAGLPVLVSQKRVDEGVTCSFAVRQTLTQHAPIWIKWLRHK